MKFGYNILRDGLQVGRIGLTTKDGKDITGSVSTNSIDLTLSNEFVRYKCDLIDPNTLNEDDLERFEADSIILEPGDFILAKTAEVVNIKSAKKFKEETGKSTDEIIGIFDGRSKLGRIGCTSHVTASVINTGFHGHIVLEIANLSGKRVKLYSGMGIGQLLIELVYGEIDDEELYHGQFNSQSKVAIPQWKNL